MPTQYDSDLSDRSDALEQRADDLQAYAQRGADQVREMIRDNAGRSVFVALGAGLGVGLVIGSVLARNSRSARWWNRSTAEGLGRRILSKVEELTPATLNSRFRR